MYVKIEPRKPTDRGGYLCMPLKRDKPMGPDWILEKCQECGRECWRLNIPKEMLNGAIPLCTECALKKGAQK